MAALDPNTGRTIWSGPNGEAGSASPDAFIKAGYAPGKVQSIEWDGRTHYYVPGFAADPGRASVYNSNAPGAGDTLAGPGGFYTAPDGGSTGDPSYAPPGSTPNPDAPGAYSPGAPEFQPAPIQDYQSPIVDPSQDPAFSAFQRALQVNEDNLRSDVARRMATAKQNLQDAEPGFATRLREGLRSIGLDNASRGTWSSSARLDDENRLNDSVNTDRSAATRAEANQESDLQTQLTQQLAANQLQLTDQSNLARDRLTQRYAVDRANNQTVLDNAENQRYRDWLVNHPNTPAPQAPGQTTAAPTAGHPDMTSAKGVPYYSQPYYTTPDRPATAEELRKQLEVLYGRAL